MNSFIRALLRLNEHAIPIGLTTNALWWGLILLVVPDTFNDSYSYRAMAQFAPEATWSAIFFVVALVQLSGLAFCMYRIQIVGAFLSCGMWITVGAMFVIGNPLSTATGNYCIWGTLSVMSLILVIYEKAR